MKILVFSNTELDYCLQSWMECFIKAWKWNLGVVERPSVVTERFLREKHCYIQFFRNLFRNLRYSKISWWSGDKVDMLNKIDVQILNDMFKRFCIVTTDYLILKNPQLYNFKLKDKNVMNECVRYVLKSTCRPWMVSFNVIL